MYLCFNFSLNNRVLLKHQWAWAPSLRFGHPVVNAINIRVNRFSYNPSTFYLMNKNLSSLTKRTSFLRRNGFKTVYYIDVTKITT